ncbi:hypothetical protein H8E88_18125 [candidate division KSB1 bacterium]|nr:hypothetical protein [candidate division KSB1 bacterium]
MKNHKVKSIHQIISFILIVNLVLTGLGFCSISADHEHEQENGTCLHFHQPGKDTEHHEDPHNDCHHDDKDKKHDEGKIHCHTCQIIVCLNDFTVFISIHNYEPFFENPLTSFISFISKRIEHIPIHSS